MCAFISIGLTTSQHHWLIAADSVSAGDDGESHGHTFPVPPQASVPELVRLAMAAACRLAGIAGDWATWIVKAGGHGR